MPLLRRLRVLAAAIEATPGTAESLDAGDATMNCYNVVIQPNIEIEQRERQGSFANLTGISGPRTGTVTFQTDIEWDGTAAEPAWATTFLPACGWYQATAGVFVPADEVPGTNVKTLTIGVYENGMRKLLHGCAGNFEIVLPTGRRGYINWTFQGVWNTPTDTTILSPSYTTAESYKYSNATTSFNSVNLCLSQLAFSSGNTITAKQCADNAAGIDYFLISNRQATATGNPEAALVATADHYGNLISHTVGELTATLTGNTSDTIEFEMPAAQIQAIAEGDREGLQVDDITWQANYHANSPFRIIFTVA